jgi:NhaP-type Na+/H+ or K+/H+ antiporter
MFVLATSSFDTTALVLGGLLVLGALVAGVARRSFLSLTAVFVLAGFVLGPAVCGVLRFDPRSGFVDSLATVALIVILFRDGLEVEAEMLQRAWRLPLRSLVIAMPLTAVVVAAFAKLVTSLSWTEAFLLGALLSPTDPVLSSSVITNPRIPRRIRHSLNLESGLNDGLALPAVLAFAAALDPTVSHFVWWRFVLQDIGVGLLTGLIIGGVAAATSSGAGA